MNNNITKCIEYNEDAEIISYDIENYEIPNIPKIFRKYCDDIAELQICNFLYKNPHPNCVNIYKIFGNYIDMEYLNTTSIYTKNEHYAKILLDIKKAIEYLNKNNIVYIDIKLDNIGYCLKDKIYKLFDFNVSGIVDKSDNTKWIIKPYEAYIYRKYYEQNKDIQDLYDIDRFALEFFKNTDLK